MKECLASRRHSRVQTLTLMMHIPVGRAYYCMCIYLLPGCSCCCCCQLAALQTRMHRTWVRLAPWIPHSCINSCSSSKWGRQAPAWLLHPGRHHLPTGQPPTGAHAHPHCFHLSSISPFLLLWIRYILMHNPVIITALSVRLLNVITRPKSACLAGVKAGCVRLCRVEGNTVWFHTVVRWIYTLLYIFLLRRPLLIT